MKNKFFTAVSLIILLCLSGCVASPTATPTPTPKPTPVPTSTPIPTSTPVPASAETGVIYKNTQYGFSVDLPASWKGYSVIEDTWSGVVVGDTSKKFSGPKILIRNPAFTEKEPTQDIPIMIFTLDEWNGLSEGQFHVGAAPINPSELALNSKYVFALPARYNFSYLKGWEEVQKILEGKAVKPIDIK